jgi:hypothetical protein
VLLPDGSEFGSILKTAFGPCKCSRRFLISCQKTNRERVELEVEVHLTTPTEFLVSYGLIFKTILLEGLIKILMVSYVLAADKRGRRNGGACQYKTDWL